MPPSDARPIPNQDTATARGRSSWTDLRAEILRRVNLIAAPGKVDAVLIEEMLVQ